MSIYRKLYKEHFGPIPKDQNGQSYDIHHIDGNHNNNVIENLVAVSVQEHYDIHYKQGDFGACQKIALRIGMTSKKLSEIATKSNLRRSANGTNPFVGGEIQRETQRRLVAEGTHHFLGGALAKERVANGTHNFLDKEKAKERAIKRVAEGKCSLSNKPIVTCPHCGKSGDNSNMKRWHFNNCKNNGNKFLDSVQS